MRHGRRLHSWREHLCWTRSSSRASGERPSQCPAKGGGQVRFYRLLLVTPTLLAVNLGHLHTCNICSIVVVLHTITRIQWNPIDRTTPGWVEEDQKTLFSTHNRGLTIDVHHYAPLTLFKQSPTVLLPTQLFWWHLVQVCGQDLHATMNKLAKV